MPEGASSRLNAAVAEVLARNPRDAEEREEAIEDVCRDDLALARQVRRRIAEQVEATQPTEAGIRALGPYVLLTQIGQGGMGAVYRARDTRLRREVAVKVLSPAVAAQPDLVARFDREARAVAALKHPNVVIIHDVGYEADTHFLVMDLLDGKSLREAVARGPLPASRAIHYIRQVCSGLAVAHAQGIVHRDLKPGNIIITRDGRAVLVDFGIAKTVTEDAADRSTFATTIGGVIGTPQYMSPEQVRGLRVDHRSDIFSLGVILFELLTGESPFERPTLADCLSAVLTDDPLERREGDSLPPELRGAVRTCLVKDPEGRFPSAAALAAALAPFAEDAPSGARATTIAHPAPEIDLGLVVRKRSALGPGLTGAVAVAAALLVGTGIWMATDDVPAEVPPAPLEPASDGNRPVPLGGAGSPAGLEPASVSPPEAPRGAASPGAGSERRDAASAPAIPAEPAPAAAPGAGGRGRAGPGADRADARPEVDVAARDEHRRRAFDAFASGRHRESLRLAESGLQLYAGDPELRRLLDDLEGSARARSRTARDAANAEPAARASWQYAEADARFEAGRQLANSRRNAEAIRAFWHAEERFDEALLAADVPTTGVDSAGTSAGAPAAGSSSRARAEGSRGASGEADAAAIQAALDEYRRAYESRSSAAVRRVDPGLTTDELRALDREFLDWADYRRELRVLRTSVGADRAEVVVAITDYITPRSGVSRQVARQAVFSLERSNGLWIIADVRYVG